MAESAPSAAERARTVLAAAASLTVTAGERRAHLSGRHAVDADGRISLDVPGDSGLPAAIGRNGEAPAVVDLTDIAPVAMRHRIRARLTIAGWLTAATPQSPAGALRFTPVTARLVDGADERATDLDGEAMMAAEPDPLADTEADLLCHLADAHRDAVDHLTRLLPAERLQGVRAVFPLGMDRYGIVLRLEDIRCDRDARLAFRAPLRTAADAPAKMLDLLRRAHNCRRRVT
jgi:hypothetical protein